MWKPIAKNEKGQPIHYSPEKVVFSDSVLKINEKNSRQDRFERCGEGKGRDREENGAANEDGDVEFSLLPKRRFTIFIVASTPSAKGESPSTRSRALCSVESQTNSSFMWWTSIVIGELQSKSWDRLGGAEKCRQQLHCAEKGRLCGKGRQVLRGSVQEETAIELLA